MKIYFVQHGEAAGEQDDPQRRLTSEGRLHVLKVAGLLAVSGLVKITKIYHSDKLRAKQTAELFAGALRCSGNVHEIKGIGPMDTPDECIKLAETETENFMLVGHLPHLGKVVSKMVSGRDDKYMVAFHNAGVICVEKQADSSWAVAPLL